MQSSTFCRTLVLLLNVAWGCSAKQPVTIDSLLAQHQGRSVSPTWAPDGKSFFYLQGAVVYRYSVIAHRAAEWFRPETLAREAATPVRPKEFGWQNRRVAADNYQWFPNSSDVLAETGGDLFIVHENGRFEQLTKTDMDEEDPKLSPDGKLTVYRWKSNLYVLDLATRQARQLTADGTPTLLNGQLDWVYPEELDLGTAVWWSPDSKQIAYLQFDVSHEFVYPQVDLTGERAFSEPERYPQAGTPNALVKLGIMAASGDKTVWMQLGETSNTLLGRVAWLPDQSAVAVEQFSRVQDKLDLLFCNPRSGAVRPVVHEESKTWLNVADNLVFLKSRPEFLWTSERTGFRHLYRYSDKGELLGQLTSGDWQVDGIAAVNEQVGRVYYTSSQASPLETQLYDVPFDGGEITRITKEEGWHRIQANAEGTYFVDAYSSLKQPEQTELRDGSGKQVAVLEKRNRSLEEEYDLQPPQIEQLKTPDGVTLYARLIKPANFQPGVKYPAIVSVYGGPGAQSVQNRWLGLSMEQVYAAHGYVVWQLDNRGSSGRGHAFESPIYHNLGKQEVADQKLGVEHLIQMGLVDPQKIGVTGWSYGGYMTIHCLLFAPNVFKVGVAGAPVTDWHNYDTIYTERYMDLPNDNPSGYETSSNVKNARLFKGRLLILHNIEDDNVLFQNSMQMAKALEQADKEFVMQLYPQKTHGVSGPLRKPLYQAMLDFFDRQLKPEQQASETAQQ